jgi:hypothetical protein
MLWMLSTGRRAFIKIRFHSWHVLDIFRAMRVATQGTGVDGKERRSAAQVACPPLDDHAGGC